MEHIDRASTIFEEANWYQPSMWKSKYELRVGENVWAVLENQYGFTKWMTSVTCTFEGYRLKINKTSFWKEKYSVLNNHDEEVASVRLLSWKTYRLITKMGESYELDMGGFWKYKPQWIDIAEDPIMIYEPNWFSFKKNDTLKVLQQDLDIFTVGLLSCTGFYLIHKMRQVAAT